MPPASATFKAKSSWRLALQHPKQDLGCNTRRLRQEGAAWRELQADHRRGRPNPNRVAGAVGFNVRDGSFYVFRAKAVIVAAGGASHIFKPRSVGEGMGRTWYAPWSSASAYGLVLNAGAQMI